MGVVWLAIPALALADDPNEKGTPASNPLGTGGLICGAAVAGGAGLMSRRQAKNQSLPGDESPAPTPEPPQKPPDQKPVYDPSGLPGGL
jgi:hypothetical protein